MMSEKKAIYIPINASDRDREDLTVFLMSRNMDMDATEANEFVCDKCGTVVILPDGHKRPSDRAALKCPTCKE